MGFEPQMLCTKQPSDASFPSVTFLNIFSISEIDVYSSCIGNLKNILFVATVGIEPFPSLVMSQVALQVLVAI